MDEYLSLGHMQYGAIFRLLKAYRYGTKCIRIIQAMYGYLCCAS